MANAAVGPCASKAAIEKRAEEFMERVRNGTSAISVTGSDAFRQKALADLEQVASTPTGLAVVEGIERSGHNVNIVETAGGNNAVADSWADSVPRADGSPGPGSDSTVNFNADRREIGDGSESWTNRDPAVGLGHELIHSYHAANGTLDGRGLTDGGGNVQYTDANGDTRSTLGAELQAVGFSEYEDHPLTENNLRQDMGEVQRPYY
jgi:hypothetical protein